MVLLESHLPTQFVLMISQIRNGMTDMGDSDLKRIKTMLETINDNVGEYYVTVEGLDYIVCHKTEEEATSYLCELGYEEFLFWGKVCNADRHLFISHLEELNEILQ